MFMTPKRISKSRMCADLDGASRVFLTLGPDARSPNPEATIRGLKMRDSLVV